MLAVINITPELVERIARVYLSGGKKRYTYSVGEAMQDVLSPYYHGASNWSDLNNAVGDYLQTIP